MNPLLVSPDATGYWEIIAPDSTVLRIVRWQQYKRGGGKFKIKCRSQDEAERLHDVLAMCRFRKIDVPDQSE
jgi:hypothetical protein